MIVLLSAHGYGTPDAVLLTLVCRLLTLWFAVAIGSPSLRPIGHQALELRVLFAQLPQLTQLQHPVDT